MAANRTRDVQLNFRVSPHELELIEKKMSQVGTKNREAYLRKMAIDGIVVNLEIPELKELLSLMRYTSNNINQLTRRVHETGRIYDADLEDILQKQDALWDGLKEILTQLGKLLELCELISLSKQDIHMLAAKMYMAVGNAHGNVSLGTFSVLNGFDHLIDQSL